MNKDQRQSHRLEMTVHAKLISIDETKSAGRVTITNLSETGLCLVADQELKPGTAIVVGLPVESPVLLLRATIVWCRRTSRQYPAGATFTDMGDSDKDVLKTMLEAIHTYREEAFRDQRRSLTEEQAIHEWLEKRMETHFLRK